MNYNNNTAYVVGVSIGDGNLSNPNKKAVRLRVTCDNKYPFLRKRIVKSLKILLPNNEVSIINKKRNSKDISVYSNKLEELLGWKANCGPKYIQKVSVPDWIKKDKLFTKACLKGLFETDGSVYKDRKYIYTNFTTIIKELSDDVNLMIKSIGYNPNTQKIMQISGKYKYVIRVSSNSKKFIKDIKINKK